MDALKLPEREFTGLLNFVQERIQHVYGINLLGTASKNTITSHTSKLKSISKYQRFTCRPLKTKIIFFCYIDTSVLLENIPLVKFIKTTSGI